jgi:hypothetical protein
MKRFFLFLLAIMCLAGCAKRSNQSTTDENPLPIIAAYIKICTGTFDTFDTFLQNVKKRRVFGDE